MSSHLNIKEKHTLHMALLIKKKKSSFHLFYSTRVGCVQLKHILLSQFIHHILVSTKKTAGIHLSVPNDTYTANFTFFSCLFPLLLSHITYCSLQGCILSLYMPQMHQFLKLSSNSGKISFSPSV